MADPWALSKCSYSQFNLPSRSNILMFEPVSTAINEREHNRKTMVPEHYVLARKNIFNASIPISCVQALFSLFSSSSCVFDPAPHSMMKSEWIFYLDSPKYMSLGCLLARGFTLVGDFSLTRWWFRTFEIPHSSSIASTRLSSVWYLSKAHWSCSCCVDLLK